MFVSKTKRRIVTLNGIKFRVLGVRGDYLVVQPAEVSRELAEFYPYKMERLIHFCAV